MRALTFLIPAVVLGSSSLYAQDITEAYNLSNLTVQGTARSMGFGNALGSVGADFSTLSVNPAGLGVYRSSELTFTPSLRINAANTNYAAGNNSDNNVHFNINNFGLVFTSAPKGERYARRNWKAVSFAFGMNRTADFNHNYNYGAYNNTSSGSQVFESDANYDYVSANAKDANTLGYMGYQSYLLNEDAKGVFHTIVPYQGGVNQLKTVHENGGVNEYTISLGGNYKERLMLGATIGIPSFRYFRNSTFTETIASGNTQPNPDGFYSFNYNTLLDISGGGINAKIGAIYKISDMFRIGAAFHSPTYYSITDLFTPSLSTTCNNSTVVSIDNGFPVQNQFNYNMVTPWRGVISATGIMDKYGFLTADIEYVDYSTMRYLYPVDPGYSYQAAEDAMNKVIRDTYKPTVNFRLGGELRFAKYFMARAGFGYYGNAYTAYGQANAGYSTERIDLSTGVGFRFKHFFTDLGIVHSNYQGYEQPYAIDYNYVASGAPATIPTARVTYGVNNVALTCGVKF